jgi:hypothetical protein
MSNVKTLPLFKNLAPRIPKKEDIYFNWNKSGNGRKGVKRIVSLTIIGDY